MRGYRDTRKPGAPLADGGQYLAPGQTETTTAIIARREAAAEAAELQHRNDLIAAAAAEERVKSGIAWYARHRRAAR